MNWRCRWFGHKWHEYAYGYLTCLRCHIGKPAEW